MTNKQQVNLISAIFIAVAVGFILAPKNNWLDSHPDLKWVLVAVLFVGLLVCAFAFIFWLLESLISSSRSSR